MAIRVSAVSVWSHRSLVRRSVLPSGRLCGRCPCRLAGARTGAERSGPAGDGSVLPWALCPPTEAAWGQSDLLTACLSPEGEGACWGRINGAEKRPGEVRPDGPGSNRGIPSPGDVRPCVSISASRRCFPPSFWPCGSCCGGIAREKKHKPAASRLVQLTSSDRGSGSLGIRNCGLVFEEMVPGAEGVFR